MASNERAYDAKVRLEARAECDRILLADEVRELTFKVKVKIKRAVEKARAGTTRSILLNRLNSRLHDFWTCREAKVVV